MPEPDDGRGNFWSSVPGLLTGLAALLVAGTGAYVAIYQPQQRRDAPTQSTAASQEHPGAQSAALGPTVSPPAAAPLPDPGQKRYNGPMGPLEAGISYNQGDLYDRPSSSPQQCSDLCSGDDRCLAATFITSQQRCWLKNSIGPIGRSSDMTSSRRIVQ